MSFGVKKVTFLVLLFALSAAAYAKPAHLLYHAGAGITYPVRHPAKAAHKVWKALKEVF